MFKTFNPYKILQMLYYLQSKTPNKSEKYSYMYLLKLLFLADRLHIRSYGVPISFTRYVAMKNGPVSSETKDMLLLEFSFFFDMSEKDKQFVKDNIIKLDEYNREIKKQKETLLSESVKETLKFSIDKFGKFDRFQLSEITHDYPEWKKIEKNQDMSLCDFFDNPDLSEATAISLYFKGKDPFAEDEKFLLEMKKQCKQLYE